MSNKGEGRYIGIKFTEELIGGINPPEKLHVTAVIASSQYSPSFIPEYAIDGDITTRWASVNKSGTQYIQFDLGSIQKIGKIKVMCGSGYIPELFNLLVSNNGIDFTTISTGNIISAADTLQDFIFSAVDCRYIRLVMTSTSNGSFYELKEFEAYGVGNEIAFKIKWQEQLYINGPPINRECVPLEISRHPTISNTILLEVGQYERFFNADGNINVEYDMNKGNLRGLGGFVESFIQEFIPEGLVKKLNPNSIEHFEIIPDVSIAFTKVEYIHGYAFEHFKITPSVSINFEYVGEINP